MRILVCTTVLPSSRSTGGEIVSQAFVDGLRAAGHDVHVLGYARPGGTAADGEEIVGWRPIETDAAGLRAFAWVARALLTGRPYSSAKYSSTAYRNRLRGFLSDPGVDLVVLDHAQIAFLARHVASARFVLVAHNVEGDLYAEQARSAHGPRRLLLRREARHAGRLERRAARRAVAVWSLTPDDTAFFGPTAVTFQVPSLLRPPSSVGPGPDVGLLGTWTWKPNAAGLAWFATRVRPLLPTGCRVEAAGRGAAEALGSTPGIEAIGPVEDAASFLGSARVVAVPSVAGAGVQVKTIDALAVGARIVATRLAVRGLEPAPPVVIADDERAFARAIETALADESSGASDAARAWSDARRAAFAARVAEEAERAVTATPRAQPVPLRTRLRRRVTAALRDTPLEGPARRARNRLRRLLRGETAGERDDRAAAAIIDRVVGPDSVCVDIGANRGAILERFVMRAPAVRHHAFEPLPDFATRLRRRFPRVDVHQVALSDHHGTEQFFHVVSAPAYSGLRRRDYPGVQEVESITVEVTTLDDALPPGTRVDFVKIDVEGAELGVLRGGRATIGRDRPFIVFEHGLGAADHYGTAPGAVYDLLAEYGLQVSRLDGWLDGAPPLSRAAFISDFETGERFSFLAHR